MYIARFWIPICLSSQTSKPVSDPNMVRLDPETENSLSGHFVLTGSLIFLGLVRSYKNLGKKFCKSLACNG